MSETLRVAVCATGADVSVPPGWVVYVRGEDGHWTQDRYEPNPDYVAPPPETEIDRARWAVEDAERELAEARAYLADLTEEIA